MGLLAWFRSLGVAPRPSVDSAGFSTGRFKDLENLEVRPVDPADLPVGFSERLRRACEVDQNIRGLWIHWVTSKHTDRELLTVLALEIQDNETVRTFLQRIYSEQGPQCAAAVTTGAPPSPWYRKGAL